MCIFPVLNIEYTSLFNFNIANFEDSENKFLPTHFNFNVIKYFLKISSATIRLVYMIPKHRPRAWTSGCSVFRSSARASKGFFVKRLDLYHYCMQDTFAGARTQPKGR